MAVRWRPTELIAQIGRRAGGLDRILQQPLAGRGHRRLRNFLGLQLISNLSRRLELCLENSDELKTR
jgi:hypothetical protein